MSLATNRASFIRSVADRLRGPFKQSEYGRVILPFTVRRRLESILEPTRDDLEDYVSKFSPIASGIFTHFCFGSWIETLENAGQIRPRESVRVQ